MIERHVTFHVFPDKGKDFEDLFVEKYRPAMTTMPGFVRVELLREVRPGDAISNGHPISEH